MPGRGKHSAAGIALIVTGLGVVLTIAAAALLPSAQGIAKDIAGYGYGYGYETPTATATTSPTTTATTSPTTTATTSPTTTATSSPTTTPTATPSPPPDTTPPAFALRALKDQKLRAVRRKGLKLRAQCDETCTARVRLLVSRKTARRTGIKRKAKGPVRVGKRTVTLAAGKRKTFAVKLSRKAKRRLRGVRKVKFTIRATARDAAGNASELTRTATVRRR
jgi:hypothetical protein